MKQNILIIFFISFLITSCNGQDQKSDNSVKPLPDWQTNTFNYAKQIIPKEIEYSGNYYELTTINLKKTHITKVDNDTIVLAICSLETIDKTKSAFTYYFINPKTNRNISELQYVGSIKGCEFEIPAFIIRDINNDGKDDFIFLKLYNDKCEGNYWISVDFQQIKPITTKNDLDYYLKLKNDMRINRKIDKAERKLLQSELEFAVEEIFGKD